MTMRVDIRPAAAAHQDDDLLVPSAQPRHLFSSCTGWPMSKNLSVILLKRGDIRRRAPVVDLRQWLQLPRKRPIRVE